jgi:ankyrin repeat protein
VELLLAKGADVNATDKNGKTPLVGCTGIHADIAGLLQQHGGHE